MPDQAIIDKIKKLLALASSPNEAEAQHAMAMAQKLMAKYSISITEEEKTPEEIIQVEYTSDVFQKQGIVQQMPAILGIIPPIFGVYGICMVTQRGHLTGNFMLLGFKRNIEIAKYALDSILAQGLIEARAKYKQFRTITFGMSFWSGYTIGLDKKFRKYQEESKGIIVYDPVRKKLDELTEATVDHNFIDGVALQEGIKAGMRAEIREGIKSGNEGKLLN